MKYLVLLAVVVLVVLLSTFGIQNPYPVNVRFLGLQSGGVPLYIVTLLSALVGLLLGTLISIPGRIQRRIELRRLRQQVADQERQIADLKVLVPRPVVQPLPGERGLS